jgi:stearoyl-CoA desaturase (delta-9 desaturase)
MYTWVRDHRIHHKFTDTNADPHNSRRGFFFSHIGWLLVKPHPDVKKFGLTVARDDLKADPFVRFQHQHYYKLFMSSVVVSTLIPWFFWGESMKVSFFYFFMYRYVLSLHFTWFVNSLAHIHGTKPYDIKISAVNTNLVSMLTGGEGLNRILGRC